jgi:VWFA-related protein
MSAALLLLFALFAAAAQDTPPPTLRITVTLVQVDAVVTDSKGRHVSDLRPEDFEIRQDGELQKITYFSYTPEAAPPAAAGKAPIGPPPPLTANQVKRTVALVVDDLALSFESIARVRAALRKYVEQQMQPGDLVAIVRTGGGVAILEQFTTDKRLLLEAIDLLKWKFVGRAGLIPIKPLDNRLGAPVDGAPGEPQILDYGYSLSALGALSTIEQVVMGMRGRPGRKSVVFFSDALRIDQDVNSAMDRLTDLSNRSAVSLYAIDPGGIRTKSPTAQNDVDRAQPDAGSIIGNIAASLSEDTFQSQEGMRSLARRTGGLFFSSNDILGGIRQATDDQLGYYLLGYSPREGTFERNPQKAKYHQVAVRVRRPGLHVRWKSGFTGIPDGLPDAELASAPKTREQQLLDALASPFTATGLKVRLTSMYTNRQKTGPSVYSMLQFDAKDLTFTQEADSSWHARVEYVASAYRGIKLPALQGQRSEDIRLSDEQYRRALKEGFLFLMNDPMKQPGMFLMRAVVRDTASQRIGSASQFIQVPDTRKGQLAMSGVAVKLAPPSAAGVPGESWSEGGPAIRRFHAGQSILYAFMVINPKVQSSTKKPDLVSEMRLFRNGKLLYSGGHNPLNEGWFEDRRVVGGGIVRLGGGLTPGEYLLQVVVTDKLARKKKSQVAQWIDFEVVTAPAS